MTTRLLVVNELSPYVTLADLKQVFESYGPCMIELNSQMKCALVKYKDDNVYPTVKNHLDKSDLLGINGSYEATLQILDVPMAATQALQSANTSVTKQPQPQPEVNMGSMDKNSLQKNQGNNFVQANTGMNVERNGRTSPFQANNNNNQPVIMNKFPNNYQQNQNMMVNDPTGLKNATNRMDAQLNMKEREGKLSSTMTMPVEAPKPAQMNFMITEKLSDHEYLRSKVNPSQKISKLVDFYQTNKNNGVNNKVKAYSSYQEFALDMQTMPKVKETQGFESRNFVPNEGLKDIETMTIAELSAELRKAGVSITGSKQVLKYHLERFRNENWLLRG